MIYTDRHNGRKYKVLRVADLNGRFLDKNLQRYEIKKVYI
jgi:hypothetical protein